MNSLPATLPLLQPTGSSRETLDASKGAGTPHPTIAALFVLVDGPYSGLAAIDLWDQERDARLYIGPYPVVAHPPCERWGRYWHGGPSARVRRVKGDDGGCFAGSLGAVRKFGGVLEHPAASAAWETFGLNSPPRAGGWVNANSIESVWAVLKRGLHGVYHHASAKHLARYVDEFTSRLNDGNVKVHTLTRLDSFIDAIVGKRLTYARLIAKVPA